MFKLEVPSLGHAGHHVFLPPVNSVNYLGAHMVSHTPMDPHFLGSDLLLGKRFPAN